MLYNGKLARNSQFNLARATWLKKTKTAIENLYSQQKVEMTNNKQK